jgi:hypothetical protein
VLLELGILWIVRVFRFFLGIQVVEVSEELVETMVSGKKLVLITQVVLPELPCRITEGLEKFRDTWVFRTQTHICARDTHLGESRTDG